MLKILTLFRFFKHTNDRILKRNVVFITDSVIKTFKLKYMYDHMKSDENKLDVNDIDEFREDFLIFLLFQFCFPAFQVFSRTC